MYTIRIDDKILYHPERLDDGFKVLAPKASLDINKNGSCSFVLPPSNRMRQDVRRRKSIVTIHQDGEEIFRGRVLDSENDTYNQLNAYCEGTRSYLNDSQAAPYDYTGTPRGLLEKLIGEHNDQVEEDKHFTVGEVTVERADEALECENVAYWETFKEIDEKLLSAYGGYMRPRIEGGVQYLDWLASPGRKNPQKIRFSINLLDLRDKQDTASMFTILRPLGAASISEGGEHGASVTIASVNGGLDYIQDDEAIAKYGRIWKTQTWPYIEDPAKLLEKGQEYMRIGAELRTITLRAIDMHFIDGGVDAIRVGDEVHIHSLPHGIDLVKVCCKIDLDIANPAETVYTFGEPPKALTDNFIMAEEEIDAVTGFKRGGGGGRSNVQQEMNGILRWAKISIDQANANINLNAGEVNSLKSRMSTAEINIDGINAQIVLKADAETVNELGMRMTQAEIEIDGANAQIVLKANQKEVDGLGTRVSEAELEIDGLNSEISLKADKITLNGYVTTSALATELAALENAIADEMYIGSFSCGTFHMGGNGISFGKKTFLTSSTSLTVNASGGTVTGVTLNKKTDTAYYLDWE